MGRAPLIVGIGELLWDMLPSGAQLGGAPANFAYHGGLLGNRASLVSRVGSDQLGIKARARLAELGLSTALIQEDSRHATGTVEVRIDNTGQPQFSIAEDTAWDHLQYDAGCAALAVRADAVCFGSLAQRFPATRQAIRRFVAEMRPGALRVFDVNLRPPFFEVSTIEDSLDKAQIAKLNVAELPLISEMFGIDPSDTVRAALDLGRRFGLHLVAVTRGSNGSILVTGSETVEHPGFPVRVADTVGAGDAFTAALVHHYLRGSPLSVIADSANRLGATVASLPGATPAIAPEIVQTVIGAD